MLLIREYVDERGHSPFARWFEDLDARAAAKVTVALARIEIGNLSNVKGVGAGVLEYRIDWGPGYRVYFGRDGATLVILLSRHQETPAAGRRGSAGEMGRLPPAQEGADLRWL
jgi:putative addiction module killer protein